jgi:hypothetical protein
MSTLFPKIGEKITTSRGLELCKYFNLHYLVERIKENPDGYNDWIFDGVSGFPENIASFLVNCDQHILTYQCALPHDLAYAYGKLHDQKEKHEIDKKFLHDLIHVAKADVNMSKIFFIAVDILGAEELKLKCTWAFANKKLN